MKTILITGAGTGFGNEVAFRLAAKGFYVIAAVEIYGKLAFPRAQFDPEPVYATLTALAAGEVDTFRNLEPQSMLGETKTNMDRVWEQKTKDKLGTRHEQVRACYDMEPEQLAA